MIKGVEVSAQLHSVRLTEELLEQVYSSMISKFVFISVDMAADFETNKLDFLVGVELAEGLSSDSLAIEVVTDAITQALDGKGNSDTAFVDSKVVAFA